MLRLIKIEWSKFRKNNVIVLLATFFFLFMPACIYFAHALPNLPKPLPDKNSFFQFPDIWEYLGYAGNWIVFFFLGVMSIYLVTIEVGTKTLRQSIINGLSRQEYYLSKVLSISILAIIATAYYALLCLLIGIFKADTLEFSMVFDNDWAISRFFLMSYAYLAFSLFLAFIFRKSGLAIFFYLSYVIIIEPLIKALISNNLESNKSIVNFLPLNAAEDLMPNPVYRLADYIPQGLDYEFLLSYKSAALATVAYIVIFLGLSYWTFLNRDI